VDGSGLALDWADEEQLHAYLNHESVMVQLAFGHNRLAAYRWLCDVGKISNIAGDYLKLPVEIRSLTHEQMADTAWSENEQRRGVNPYERAIAIEKRMKDFNWTQEQAADHLRMSRSAISNILRLLKLPQPVKEDLRQGNISERAALALMPLYELPQAIIERAEHDWNTTTKPTHIIADARTGQSSELVRERVEKIVTAFGVNLQLADWALDEEIEHSQAESLRCRGCSLRLKERNTCLDRDCFELKRRIWREAYLYKAQHAFETTHGVWLHIAEEDVALGHGATKFEYEPASKVHVIRKSGCENLRLMYTEFTYAREGSPSTLTDVGYPKAAIICRRRNGQCTCKNGMDHLHKTGQAPEPHPFRDPLPEEPTDIVEAPDHTAEEPATKHEPRSTSHVLSAGDLQEIARQARKDKAMYRSLAEQTIQRAAQQVAGLLVAGDVCAWRTLAKALLGWNWREEDSPNNTLALAQLVTHGIITEQTNSMDDRELPARLNRWLASKGLPELQPATLMDILGEEESQEA
jgi:ParB/RepB/Spo0J family partition protein